MLATDNFSAPDTPFFLSIPMVSIPRDSGLHPAVNSLCVMAPLFRLILSLYHNMPHHDFCPSVAATKTPQPDYPLGPESASMPVFQPIEVVQSSSSVITQNGRREDGLSATMGIDPTPPGFVLERHQHLPTFSGEIFAGIFVLSAWETVNISLLNPGTCSTVRAGASNLITDRSCSTARKA